MKALSLTLSTAALLALAMPVGATPRDVRDYLDKAGAAAARKVAGDGVDVGPGLDLKARVNADGRLTSLRVVKSSGSLETDQKALASLKRLRVAAPPNALLGAEVTVAVAREPVLQAHANP